MFSGPLTSGWKGAASVERSTEAMQRAARGIEVGLVLWALQGCAQLLDIPSEPRLVAGQTASATGEVSRADASAAVPPPPGASAAETAGGGESPEQTPLAPPSSGEDTGGTQTPAGQQPPAPNPAASDAGVLAPPDATAPAPDPEPAPEPECSTDADCPDRVCSAGSCRTATCDDTRRNGTETDVDCGGSCAPCAPGGACRLDADCASLACEDARCCGGTLGDCTRCARRLSGSNRCALALEAAADCDAFLQCLADNADECPRRLASGCSNQAGSVCDVQRFGGTGSAAIVRADSILGSAQCSF